MLHSVVFMNARALAGAQDLAASDVGNRRASMEVSLTALPRHWGYFVCCGLFDLLHALERLQPRPAELEKAKAMGLVSESFAELLGRGTSLLDINTPAEGSVLFAGDPVATLEGPLWLTWLCAGLIRAFVGPAGIVATRASRLAAAAHPAALIDATSSLQPDLSCGARIARAAHIGGTQATQNPAAAALLGIPLRVSRPPEVLSLVEQEGIVRHSVWAFRSTTPGTLLHLGPGDDEEETLIDYLRAKPVQGIAWAARSLDSTATGLSLRTDLVALEEGGSWKSRLGAIPDVTVVPGRKLVVRYRDRSGQPIADVMHGVSERIQPASSAVVVGYLGVDAAVKIDGAATATPLLAPALRSGRTVAVSEPIEVPRERLKKALAVLPAAYARLRHPARFPVGSTTALADRRAELVRGFP